MGTKQKNLFDLYTEPLARNTDPETSHQVADEIKADGVLAGMYLHVLALVESNPSRTGRELDRLSPTTDGQAHKRLCGLERRGWVVRGEVRRCEVSGRIATTWRPVFKQDKK
jgi:hypothetical protein